MIQLVDGQGFTGSTDLSGYGTVRLMAPSARVRIGAKGIGEIGITGSASAVAKAMYQATGKRVRDLPITPDMLL